MPSSLRLSHPSAYLVSSLKRLNVKRSNRTPAVCSSTSPLIPASPLVFPSHSSYLGQKIQSGSHFCSPNLHPVQYQILSSLYLPSMRSRIWPLVQTAAICMIAATSDGPPTSTLAPCNPLSTEARETLSSVCWIVFLAHVMSQLPTYLE